MMRFSRYFTLLLLTVLLLVPTSFSWASKRDIRFGWFSSAPIPQTASDVKVSGSLKPDKVKGAQTSRGTITIEIPSNLHVQSNKPLDKFLVPTKLDIDAPQGLKVGPITYPRAQMRKLAFSKKPVAVYEGLAVIRFNIIVPAKFSQNSAELKGRLRFQACNNDACFPPQTREVKLSLAIE